MKKKKKKKSIFQVVRLEVRDEDGFSLGLPRQGRLLRLSPTTTLRSTPKGSLLVRLDKIGSVVNTVNEGDR